MSSRSRPSLQFASKRTHSLNGSIQSNGKLSGLSILSCHSSAVFRSSTPSERSTSPERGHNEYLPRSESSIVSVTSITSDQEAETPISSATGKENVIVTVRFRPLSSRELQRGDKLAWYADGDTLVRSTLCASALYAFDKVFGPATTTRNVYETAAQHVVKGAMEGVNGTVFAYGVTSSGKTHTMHGDKTSPGIIPLAIEDVFKFSQENSERDFLLRVSYLEIYNEIINDLLNPGGHNLRIREDAQGAYVEGLREVVVLSPEQCLSLIMAGEEHRHVGSNNFNLVSSRSHTIFTLTIESGPGKGGGHQGGIIISQLNLIDLAGSESAKTETTGLRRKEGCYINKSLLTLGTVISKLTDGKATHIPYRDSKLTRLLQSSLSGHGRISLICTITPATSSNEETHNTLKFAHRAKQVEIQALPNKIMDEKALIKHYEKEIQRLKHELELLKRRLMEISESREENKEESTNLNPQIEPGHVNIQERLHEEAQVKTALLDRIQRLTKLILVSTRDTASHVVVEGHADRKAHLFGNEEINPAIFISTMESDNLSNTSSIANEKHMDLGYTIIQRRSPSGRKGDDASSLGSTGSPQAHDNFDKNDQAMQPLVGGVVADEMDLLREQVKFLAGEVMFCTNLLKGISDPVQESDDDDAQNLESKDVQNAIIPLEDKEKSTFQNAHIEEMNLESSFGQETRDETAHLRLKLLKKEMEIEKLMIERDQLLEERDAIQATNLTLAEEALYAKDLASAATMESMRLHQEVKELCVQNSKLAEELANAQNISYAHVGLSPDSKEYLRQSCSIRESGMYVLATEASEERTSDDVEGRVMREKQEVAVESLLAGKESDQLDLWHRLDKARKKEFNLENELTELWALVSSFKESPTLNDPIKVNFECIPTPPEVPQVVEPMGCECEYGCTIVSSDLSKEGHHPTGLQTIITQVECEDLEELDLASLDDLCSLHREALDRLCQAKAKVRERLERRQTGCHFVEAAYNLQINGRPS